MNREDKDMVLAPRGLLKAICLTASALTRKNTEDRRQKMNELLKRLDEECKLPKDSSNKDIRGNSYYEVEIRRYDEDGEGMGAIKVRISHNQNGIYITPEGYGDHCSNDGEGIPVLLEYCGGEPRVIIWDDINQEDSSHIISLKNADEKLRKED